MKRSFMTLTRLQCAAIATVLIAIVLLSTPAAVTAASSIRADFERRVNRPNSALPTSGFSVAPVPASPLPRFPQTKQNEPSIAVNPLNSQNLIAGANDEQAEPPCQDLDGDGFLDGLAECPFAANVGTSGVYVSVDGGSTWQDIGVLDTVTPTAAAGWASLDLFSSGDPAIAFDSLGNAYYATLALPIEPAPPQFEQAGLFADLVVAKANFHSASGTTGLQPTDWTPFLAVSGSPVRFDDKENIWVDTSPSSAFRDTIYLSWSMFTSNDNSPFGGIASDRIAIAHSTDGGVTWSNPVFLSRSCNLGCGGVQGSVVRTTPNGDVYVAWEESLGRTAPNAIVFSKSTDGGSHFSRPVMVASTIIDIRNPLNGPNFRDATPKAGFRDNSFPTMTVAADGAVYVAWGDSRNAASSRADVLLAKSTDGGDTWTTPMLVSQRLSPGTGDPGDQFFPWLTSSQVGASVAVSIVYYDRSYDTKGRAACTVDCTLDNKRLIGVTVAASFDGGATWKYTRADTTRFGFDPAGSSTNGQGAQFMGDYIYAASAGNKVFVVWTDARNGFTGAGKSYADSGLYGDSDIFFASLTVTP